MRIQTPYGHPLQDSAATPSLAQLKALNVSDNRHGERIRLDDGNEYYYHSSSALTADDVFVIAPTTGAGRYLLIGRCNIKLAIAFGTADAAVLATVPTNGEFLLRRAAWRVTADWTGGTSSAIGLSSSQTGHTTKGDLLGGGTGDVAAALTAALGFTLGTVGADVAAGVLLKSAATVRFDRITSAFTAGTGFVHLIGDMLANPGA